MAHILIVDDDTQILGIFMRTLTREGYTVTGTTSGRHATDFALLHQPDIMMLDLNMPETHGFEILKRLHSEAPGLKLVVVSGALQGVLLNSARLFGAVATIEKPIDPESLVRKIREILAAETGQGAVAP